MTSPELSQFQTSTYSAVITESVHTFVQRSVESILLIFSSKSYICSFIFIFQFYLLNHSSIFFSPWKSLLYSEDRTSVTESLFNCSKVLFKANPSKAWVWKCHRLCERDSFRIGNCEFGRHISISLVQLLSSFNLHHRIEVICRNIIHINRLPCVYTQGIVITRYIVVNFLFSTETMLAFTSL